ncbi:MAG: nicotinate phosphoribosyltransferase [Erysipelotrichaceae bacterium]|nr:nicotinate phosphoribosyltransferase [Erysipelotrichaceae bacterium]
MTKNPRNYSLLSDAYEFMMADAYLRNGKQDLRAVFDVYFRKTPNNGGYAVMAGLDKIVDYLQNIHFEEEDLEYLRTLGLSEGLLERLADFRFTGNVYAIPDGTPVFPNEPLITVEAPIIEAQIVETAILSMVNGPMEHATAARRILDATPKNVKVMEFGARRADGPEAALDASLYALMAGCHGTSNVLAGKMEGKKALGTMAHSFVEAFDNEYDAFMAFARCYPNNCLLLVDTYDTLRSGVPNAIKAFETMRDLGMPLDHIGIRIDSGDLAYLSKRARKMLDDAGFENATICLSNSLNAEVILSLRLQDACFNSLGVGDNISKPEGRMGCVYKEVAVIDRGKIIPKIKLSNDVIKIVNPSFKKLYRAFDKESGYAMADIVCELDEVLPEDAMQITSLTHFDKSSVIRNYTLKPLQETVFKDGKLVYTLPDAEERIRYCSEQIEKLYPEVRRIVNPHEYYVDGTDRYIALKQKMIREAGKTNV